MKVGDKVRFLDAVGGGVVSGFQGKDIVLVEDQDGFDVPVLIRNCVVVDDESEKRLKSGHYTAPATKPAAKREKPITSVKAALSAVEEDDDDDLLQEEPADKPITFKPLSQERKGGDKLSLFLCFEPVEIKELGKTEFDIYLVNDSNYSVCFTMLCGENTIWQLRRVDTADPNEKVYIETVAREDLNDLQHICIQMMAFKEEKTFMLKEPMSVELRLDLTKFYKLHTFQSNEFFNTPVLTFPLVEKDRVTSDPRKMLQEHFAPKPDDEPKREKKKPLPLNTSNGDEVVDLHAQELLDSLNGMNNADILEYQMDVFRKKMAEFNRVKGKRIVFIHGKGEGVLRKKIVSELKRKYPRCNFQDASFREYGFGATLVIIH